MDKRQIIIHNPKKNKASTKTTFKDHVTLHGKEKVIKDENLWIRASQEFKFTGEMKHYKKIQGLIFNSVIYSGGNKYSCGYNMINYLQEVDPDKAKELKKTFENLIISRDQVLFDFFDLKQREVNSSVMDFKNKKLGRDQFVNHRYIHYSKDLISKKKQLYTNPYVLENYIPNSCVLSTIIDVFKDKYESYYTSRKLTYETLFKMLKPEGELDSKSNYLSINDAIEGFFKPLNLECYFMDSQYHIRVFHKPEKRNTHLKCVSYYMIHNTHIHHLNNNLDSMKEIRDKFLTKQETIKPKNTFGFMNTKEGDQYVMIKSYEDLLQVIESDSEGKNIQCLYEEDSLVTLWNQLYLNNYEATPYFKNSEMVQFFISNIGDKRITVFSYKQLGVSLDIKFMDIQTFIHYQNKKRLVFQNLLSRNYLSNYSDSAKKMFQNNVKGGIIGTLKTPNKLKTVIKEIYGMKVECTEDSEFYQLDMNRYYCSILKDLEYIPIINSFDNFINYDGSPIEDYNLYYVKKTDNEITYLSKRYELTYGLCLKTVSNYEIISYLKVSKLKANISDNIIKDLYEDELLKKDMKKGLINSLVGMFDKKKNKKQTVMISEDETECNMFHNDYNGKVVRHFINDETIIFHNIISSEAELKDGFKPISLLIKDIANMKLFQLKKELESVGFNCYACNTDCWLVDKDDELLSMFKTKYPHYFDFKDANTYDAIGKLKVEVKKFPLIKEKEVLENEPIHHDLIEHEIIPITINTEKDFDRTSLESIQQYNDEIKTHLTKNTCILGLTAGSGKSSACLYDKKSLVVCKFNALCIERRQEGYESITLNILLGMGFDGVQNTKMREYNVDDYEIIVLEEIGLYPTYDLMKIKDYMDKHPQIRFLANGDVFQLPPIEFDLTCKDTKKYYKSIIDQLFPNQILLQHCKRCDTKEDNLLVDEISRLFREFKTVDEAREYLKKSNFKKIYKHEDIVTKKNVVGMHSTSDTVNNVLHQNKDGMKYYVGMQLLGRKVFKNKMCHIHINYTYFITEIKEDKTVILYDGNMNHEIAYNLLDKYTRLSYTQTAHSLQGFTIKEKITVFDIYAPMVTIPWLYVAITRSRSLSDITLYMGSVKKISEKYIDSLLTSRIQGHILSDKDRICTGEYIDVQWIKDTMNKTKCCKGVNQKECNRLFDFFDNESFSVDRIDSNIGHIKMNCQILCLSCNKSKKNNYY